MQIILNWMQFSSRQLLKFFSFGQWKQTFHFLISEHHAVRACNATGKCMSSEMLFCGLFSSVSWTLVFLCIFIYIFFFCSHYLEHKLLDSCSEVEISYSRVPSQCFCCQPYTCAPGPKTFCQLHPWCIAYSLSTKGAQTPQVSGCFYFHVSAVKTYWTAIFLFFLRGRGFPLMGDENWGLLRGLIAHLSRVEGAFWIADRL